jgi:hypothetical protein
MTFFLERCGAKADFNPGANAVFRKAGLLHVAQILVPCPGALARPGRLRRFSTPWSFTAR